MRDNVSFALPPSSSLRDKELKRLQLGTFNNKYPMLYHLPLSLRDDWVEAVARAYGLKRPMLCHHLPLSLTTQGEAVAAG